jgi:hypothetical protein
MLALFSACRAGRLVTGTVLEFGGEGSSRCRSTSARRSRTWRSRPERSRASPRSTRSVARELATLRAGDARSLAAVPCAPIRRALRRPSSGSSSIAWSRWLRYRAIPKRVRPLAELAVRPGAPAHRHRVRRHVHRGKTRRHGPLRVGLRARRGPRRAVAPGVRLFLQVASERVRRYAEERGYLRSSRPWERRCSAPRAARALPRAPAPRARRTRSRSARQSQLSRTERSGQVILASPLVVAASALKGFVAAPSEVRA